MIDLSEDLIALAEVGEDMAQRAREFQSIAGSADLDRIEKALSSVEYQCFIARSLVEDAMKRQREQT